MLVLSLPGCNVAQLHTASMLHQPPLMIPHGSLYFAPTVCVDSTANFGLAADLLCFSLPNCNIDMPVQVQGQCKQSQMPSLLFLCCFTCRKEIEMPIMPSSLLNHPSINSLKMVGLLQPLLLDSTTSHLWAERRLFMRQLDERSALAALLKAADASEPAAVSRLGSLVKVIRQKIKQ